MAVDKYNNSGIQLIKYILKQTDRLSLILSFYVKYSLISFPFNKIKIAIKIDIIVVYK